MSENKEQNLPGLYVATSRLQESMKALAACSSTAANAMDNLAVALKGYAAMLYERKTQRRVQLVLLLILVLLTLIVGM